MKTILSALVLAAALPVLAQVPPPDPVPGAPASATEKKPGHAKHKAAKKAQKTQKAAKKTEAAK